ncbi:hypothetical protein RBI13_23255 [Alcaligenaceae bacterium A4P071]|nr:hypothetical protein [Alcaligenaceae bacterium A4P071]
MLIVLPGALPPAPYAAELASWVATRAPTLHAWLPAARATAESLDPTRDGCTAFEAWQLRRAGFTPKPGQPFGAGMGPLRAQVAADDPAPVWLAELVHLALGSDQVMLLPPDAMGLTAADADVLWRAAEPAIADSDFRIEPISPQRWRVHLPEGLAPRSGTPDAVAGHPLSAWWQTDAGFRPWRRLLNDIQMAWHDLPVNDARAERGLPPVNGLWLYGGAHAWDAKPVTDEDVRIIDALDRPHRAGDWAAWLDALAELDATVFAALAAEDQPSDLLLLGTDRSVRLTVNPDGFWRRWLPLPKKDWKAWWSPPV